MYRKLIYLASFALVLGLVGVASGAEGLLGQYYHSSGQGPPVNPWQTLVMERIDPTVNFNWGGSAPHPSVNANDFAVRWTGMIKVPTSETYTFHTQTDDGVRLWVNGQPVINNWTNHSNTHDSGDIALKAGQSYEIILEFYEDGGDARCELSWSTPTIARVTVPSRYLSIERPYARNPDPPDGTILLDTWVSMSWTPGDYVALHAVYFGENFNDVDAGTGDTFRGKQVATDFAVGFPGFPYPDGLVPGTTYYWRIVEVNDLNPESPWKGPVWSFSIAPRTAYSPNPADGAEFVDPNIVVSWEPGFGAMLHHVYFGDNFANVNNGTGGTYKGLVGGPKYTPGTLKLEKVYYWRVDEFDGFETYKGDVWSFTTPGAVGSPKPPNGAVDVRQTPILRWVAGDHTASHQVYFGTDEDTVRNATTASPEYKGTKALGSERYDPGELAWDTTYYWRVEEVNNLNPNSPWVGNVWSFTTADFLVIDDFEDYDDISNKIYDTWADYFVNNTGATVGHFDAPFAEQTIVHGGSQSMPMRYDNDGTVNEDRPEYQKTGTRFYSEAEREWAAPQDWTVKGVKSLKLWFFGESGNAVEQLYVALQDSANKSAVVKHSNLAATTISTWTEWNIDLAGFTGVNLRAIKKLSIGVGDRANPQRGGSGNLYIDDIQLRLPPLP